MEAPTDAPTLRRTPVQQRSAERLVRILDACAALLDESGYEALSTRAVAERAGVPIGSVYRFFGNKRELAAALAHRNLDEFAVRIQARLDRDPDTDGDAATDTGGKTDRPGGWRRVIDAMLDAYLEMKRTVPGFGLIDFGVPGPPDPAAPANLRVAARLCELLTARLGIPPTEAIDRACLVAVEAADALLQLAFRTDRNGDPTLVAETRTLLHAYLARTLDPA
ncbi:TetR/AcrR family transcriptional regulator [Streptomyces sp. NPDC051940]|uniref:TetR/AcrR family transcriptional regulator n=1 Tax=Streptomyces sp. NPDC051940 TaxID=3155675 RepID=UPI003440F5EB